MMMNQLLRKSIILKQHLPAVAMLGLRYPIRAFAIPKYSFDDEAFQADRF
jgi:hypothetical protein